MSGMKSGMLHEARDINGLTGILIPKNVSTVIIKLFSRFSL